MAQQVGGDEPPPRFSVQGWARIRECFVRSTIRVAGGRSPLALCIKMNVITELDAHFGVPFPAGYRDWSMKKYTDHREGMDRYLWVHEAEWIPPDEIPKYDLGRSNIIPGLIPFAFSCAGDNWCWNTQVKNGDAEYEVLYCAHDEKLADRF